MRGQLRDELYTRHKVGGTRQLLSIQGNSNGLFSYVLFMDLLNGFPISNLSVSYSGEQNVTETF